MKLYFYLTTFFISLIFITASCGGNAPANNGNTSSGPANSNLAQSGNTKATEPTSNNAPTLAPVVQQYYDALKTKDDSKLKETLTTAYVDRIQDSMKDANFKGSLAAFVAQDEYREGSNIEVRNEKINGNRASAELRGGAYKNWTTYDFALENGKWRFTGGSPDIDSMPASNVNAAR
jgi:hypothetical protein